MAIISEEVGDIFSAPSNSILIRRFPIPTHGLALTSNRRLQRPWCLGLRRSHRIQTEVPLRLPHIQRTLPLTTHGLQSHRQTTPGQNHRHHPPHSSFQRNKPAASIQDTTLHSLSIHVSRLREKSLPRRGNTGKHRTRPQGLGNTSRGDSRIGRRRTWKLPCGED